MIADLQAQLFRAVQGNDLADGEAPQRPHLSDRARVLCRALGRHAQPHEGGAGAARPAAARGGAPAAGQALRAPRSSASAPRWSRRGCSTRRQSATRRRPLRLGVPAMSRRVAINAPSSLARHIALLRVWSRLRADDRKSCSHLEGGPMRRCLQRERLGLLDTAVVLVARLRGSPKRRRFNHLRMHQVAQRAWRLRASSGQQVASTSWRPGAYGSMPERSQRTTDVPVTRKRNCLAVAARDLDLVADTHVAEEREMRVAVGGIDRGARARRPPACARPGRARTPAPGRSTPASTIALLPSRGTSTRATGQVSAQDQGLTAVPVAERLREGALEQDLRQHRLGVDPDALPDQHEAARAQARRPAAIADGRAPARAAASSGGASTSEWLRRVAERIGSKGLRP